MYTFNLLTANGNTNEYVWRGGEGTMFCEGNLGVSGVLVLQARYASGTFITLGTPLTFTASGVQTGMANFALPRGTVLRANLTGATNPSGLVTLGRVNANS